MFKEMAFKLLYVQLSKMIGSQEKMLLTIKESNSIAATLDVKKKQWQPTPG